MYAILGASGRTGGAVCEALHAAGAPFRAVVRREEAGERWRGEGVEVAVADLDDPASLEAAFEGATGVFLLSPPDPRGDDPVRTSYARCTRAGKAAQAAGVRHVVYLSSIGAQHEAGTGVIRAVHAGEAALRECGVPATFLRAAWYQENWQASVAPAVADKVLPSLIPQDLRLPMVSFHDVGAKVADAFAHAPGGKRPNILNVAGPKDYRPSDVAHVLGELLNHPVSVQEIPAGDVPPMLKAEGAGDAYATLFGETVGAIRAGRLTWEDDSPVVRGVVTIGATLAILLRAPAP